MDNHSDSGANRFGYLEVKVIVVEVTHAMRIDPTKYLIIGAGVSGWSVAEYLLARNKLFRLMDSRELPPNDAKIKQQLSKSQICFGKFDEQWLQNADVIILSPGVSPQTLEIQKAISSGAEVIGDIELFAREANKPYIAITGSNGKSTVTTLVTAILKSQGINARAGANIGKPALSLLNDESIDMYVLELSSFQLETCKAIRPEAAVVLNISDDHLDRHSSLEEYAGIKTSIYTNAKQKVIPRDNSGDKSLQAIDGAVSFGDDVPTGLHYGIEESESGRWLMQGSEQLIRSAEIPLLGVTGELNVLAALALTDLFIQDKNKALNAVRTFQGLPHRCEVIIEHHGVTWIDDSKGTNVGATISAILGLRQSIVLLIGGVHKGGSLDTLVEAVREKVPLVVVFGRDKDIFTKALKNVTEVIEAGSLSDAVGCVYERVEASQAVLFSPACASFDMFSNYVERGLVFQAAVKKCVLEQNDD